MAFIERGGLLVLCAVFSAAAAGGTATLNWTAVNHYTNGTLITVPVTYNIDRSKNGAAYVRLRTGLTGLRFVDRKLFNVKTCYTVTTVAGGVKSAPSAPGCKVNGTPAIAPVAPAIAVQP